MSALDDVEQAFRAAAAELGIDLPAELIADGKLHRCEVEGETNRKNGAYIFHLDHIASGWFKNWKSGTAKNWSSRKLDDLSAAERSEYDARVATARAAREAEDARLHAEARERAARLWEMAAPCISHEYLQRKGVKPHGLRLGSDGRLVVPMRDADGTLHTVQRIDDAGNKRFLAGGQVRGCFHMIGQPRDVIAVCEGFATGASIHEATGHAVAVAFGSDNLLHVAEALRKKYPTARIVICADDDHLREGNPGVTHAKYAAQVVGGLLAMPDFGQDRRKGDTDFNDLHQAQGFEAVKACIEEAAAPDAPSADRQCRKVALTDTGNAERFAELRGADVRFVPEWRKFVVWNGVRWPEDTGSIRVLEMTKGVARSFLIDAHACNDDKRRAAIVSHALRSEQEPKRRAMIALIKAEPPISLPHDSFDKDPMLLNVLNGTIDLRTGRLKPHDRQDLITRLLSVPYDEAATCPRWESFLREVLPDEETIAFVKRAVGYSLTGIVSEHCLFFLFGLGANGKSVFLLILMALLGDYAVQAPTSMLLAKRGDAHPTEITTLHGRRAAVCQETPSGRGWAEEIVKHITGGDRITARRMREDFWEFDPTHKLWVSGNHKPVVRGVDEGIWRRLRIVPFEKVIPENVRDHKLADKLRVELPGILAWAVQGCLEWQREGLGISAKVKVATADYRDESDRLGPFLVECCELRPDSVVPRAELYRGYTAWSEDQGERRPMSEREFVDALRSRGIEDAWTKNASGKKCRGWRGIDLAGGAGDKRPSDRGRTQGVAAGGGAAQNSTDHAPSVADEEDLV